MSNSGEPLPPQGPHDAPRQSESASSEKQVLPNIQPDWQAFSTQYPGSNNSPVSANNPYLPGDILNRLAQEREAAANTAASALEVMADMARQKQQSQLEKPASAFHRYEQLRIVATK